MKKIRDKERDDKTNKIRLRYQRFLLETTYQK